MNRIYGRVIRANGEEKEKAKRAVTFQLLIEAIAAVLRSELSLVPSTFEFLSMRHNGEDLEQFANSLEKKAEECSLCDACRTAVVSSVFVIGLECGNTKATASPPEGA